MALRSLQLRPVAALLLSVILLSTASIPPAAGAAPALKKDSRIHTRVYVIDFDPLVNGVPLHSFLNWADPLTLDQGYAAAVDEASGGIVRQKIVATSIVRDYPVKADGFRFTKPAYLGCLSDHSPSYCDELIDYAAVLNTAYDKTLGSACEALIHGKIDEVWLWGGPYFGYFEWLESAGRYPCANLSRRFVTMGFSYERGLPEMLHDLGHRAEGMIIEGLGANASGIWDAFDGQRYRYSEDYSCPPAPDATHPEVDPNNAHAGDVHFPPNAYCHYQYNRDYPVWSDAYDWASFPNLTGKKTLINSSTWGATQQGFLMWWFERFPRNAGSSGPIVYDWWRYVFLTR